MLYCYMSSPVGELLLAGDAASLHMIGFPQGKGYVARDPDWTEDAARFKSERQQLEEYFHGQRQVFDLTLSPSGTRFQLQVLEALQGIPFGTTCSYADIANRIGNPKAVRAVGAANGRNPLPIVIPCHRVIGANGSLTGFGGGLAAKAWLLAHENCLPTRAQAELF